MSFSIEIVNPKHEKAFQLNLPLFASATFCQAIADMHGIRFDYLLVSQNNEVWAAMPLFERTKYARKQLITPLLSYYNPIVWYLPEQQRANKNLSHKLEVTSIIAGYLLDKYNSININLSPDIYDMRSFQYSGLSAKPMYTFLYELTPDFEPVLYKKESASLRKARGMGIEVREEFLPEKFLDLLELTNERQERTLNIPRDKHLKLLHELNKDGILIQVNASHDNKVISSLLILNDVANKTLYAWQNGADPEYFSTGVAILVHDEVIKRYRTDYLLYDLCGANLQSVSRFKAAIGAELRLFFRLETSKSSFTFPRLR